MKAKFPDVVERGRIREGPRASEPGDTFGAFALRHRRDGVMFNVIAVADGEGWDHVSVTLQHGHRPPTWDEMVWIKRLFWSDDEWVVQYHPAAGDYINQHVNCLHLWRPVGVDFPVPPKAFV